MDRWIGEVSGDWAGLAHRGLCEGAELLSKIHHFQCEIHPFCVRNPSFSV